MKKFSKYYKEAMSNVDDKYGSFHKALADMLTEYVGDILKQNMVSAFAYVEGEEIIGEAVKPIIGAFGQIQYFILRPLTEADIKARLVDGSRFFQELYQFVADILNESTIYWNIVQNPLLPTITYLTFPTTAKYNLDFTKWGDYVYSIVSSMKITDPDIFYEQLDTGMEGAFNDLTQFKPQPMENSVDKLSPNTTLMGGVIQPGGCYITPKLNIKSKSF